MVVRPIAETTEIGPVSALIEAGQYRDAINRVVGEIGDDLGQYCMAVLHDRDLARQAMLKTLVELYGTLPAPDGTPIRTRVFVCARRACAHIQSGAPPPAPTETEADSECAETRRLLQSLPPDERDACLLRYLARLNYADVARVCGMDEDSVRKKVSKGLLRVRQQLLSDEHDEVPPLYVEDGTER